DPNQRILFHIIPTSKALVIMQSQAEVRQHTEPNFEILAEAVHIEAAGAGHHPYWIPATIPAKGCVGAAEPAALEIQGLQSALELIAFKATHAGWILEEGGGILRARSPACSRERHVFCSDFRQE